MHLEVTFRNLNARPEVQKRAQLLFSKLHRFLAESAEATLVLGVEHQKAIVELVIMNRGQNYKATTEDEELRDALDSTFHKMEGQLRRAKEKRSHKGRGTPDEFGGGTTEDEAGVEEV